MEVEHEEQIDFLVTKNTLFQSTLIAKIPCAHMVVCDNLFKTSESNYACTKQLTLFSDIVFDMPSLTGSSLQNSRLIASPI